MHHERKPTAEVSNTAEVTGKLDNPHNSGNGSTENQPVVDRVINSSLRDRPEWTERGRVACREGRKLTATPFGQTGLSVEGHLRAEAWVRGWTMEAVESRKSPVEI